MKKDITIKEFLEKIEQEIKKEQIETTIDNFKEKNERIVALSHLTGMIEGCLTWID